jgi:hypothetical protein
MVRFTHSATKGQDKLNMHQLCLVARLRGTVGTSGMDTIVTLGMFGLRFDSVCDSVSAPVGSSRLHSDLPMYAHTLDGIYLSTGLPVGQPTPSASDFGFGEMDEMVELRGGNGRSEWQIAGGDNATLNGTSARISEPAANITKPETRSHARIGCTYGGAAQKH